MTQDMIDVAEAAICLRSAQMCESDSITSEEVNNLAGSVAALKWGPQGGSKHLNERAFNTNVNDTVVQQNYDGRTDAHITEHDEMRRRENPTGFSPSDEETDDRED